MSEGKVAIVTVHGTGDTAESADGGKWFQRGSQFSDRLLAHLSGQGVSGEVIPHLWSGANSAWDRERGANKLAARIRGLYRKYDTIHVVAHSHGGNVANDAAVLLKWGLRRNAEREKFDSLTTIGTPFFNVRTGVPQRIAGILFTLIAWGSAIVFPLLAAFLIWGALSGENVMDMGSQQSELMATAIYILIVGPCTLFMLNMSRQGIRRILRPKTGGRTRTSVFSIWHQNDEAIAFLQRVEELNLEPFPRGSLYRGSRGVAISLGVLAVLLIGLLNPLLYSLGRGDLFGMMDGIADEDTAGNIVAMTMISLLLAPAIFTVVYFAYRFLVGGFVQEVGVRGSMNRFVGGVMRGVAMGRDGDQMLYGVSTTSHTHTTQELVLSGDCAARMQEGANTSVGKLIDKYRWSLFAVGGDSNASLTALTTDTMTWDSLVHTTYFDQPEVAAAIGDHIVRTVRESAHAAAPAPSSTATLPAMT
ncbi:MAG: hypothetical protein R3C27_04470 [Hyphomonadaceae bacterium]